MTGAGLYVHVPFCSSICPYCDFAVTTGRRERDGPRHVDAVLAELAASSFPHAFDTVYLGGGTPSWLPTSELRRLVGGICADPRVGAHAALHLEANPEDATDDAVGAWRELGVAFASLGVQSFDAAELAFLGRAHSPEEARAAARRCVAAGITTVSVDVIFGSPGQSDATLTATLEAAAACGIHHLSCYQLTVHEGTPLARTRDRGALAEVGDERQARLFGLVHRTAARLGFAAYEVSNFAAAPEHRSRHNAKYWSHAPYLGVGPSAHSFDGRTRWWNARPFIEWSRLVAAGEAPVAGREELSREQLATERVMLGLRTAAGVDLAAIEADLGLRPSRASRGRIDFWYERGFATSDGRRLRLTRRGWAVADALAAEIDLETVR